MANSSSYMIGVQAVPMAVVSTAEIRLRYPELDFFWQRVREKAGLPDRQFKYLRSQTAIYAVKAGVPLTVASRTLGHSDEKMTRRYQKRKAPMKPEEALRIEEAMLGQSNSQRLAV